MAKKQQQVQQPRPVVHLYFEGEPIAEIVAMPTLCSFSKIDDIHQLRDACEALNNAVFDQAYTVFNARTSARLIGRSLGEVLHAHVSGNAEGLKTLLDTLVERHMRQVPATTDLH